MSTIDREIARAERVLDGYAHVERIASAMAPDPSEWHYTGDVNDTGPRSGATCTCGASIRYEYVIERERDGAKLPIGSVCIGASVPWLIEHGAAGLARTLTEARERHRAALAEKARRERDAAASTEVEVLRADFDALLEWRKAAREVMRERRVRYLPDLLTGKLREPGAATTPGRTAAAYRTRLATALRDHLLFYYTDERHGCDGGRLVSVLPPLPVPADAKLRAKVLSEVERAIEWSLRSEGRAYGPTPEHCAMLRHAREIISTSYTEEV